jgi:macrolide transport system ATP-binding/permease protein
MLLIECSKIKKYFIDRLVLDIDSLKIYSEDKIGIIGANGVGKTTLLNILSKRLEPDEGRVELFSSYSYISQLEDAVNKSIGGEIASKLGVSNTWNDSMSGGEKTRFKLAESLSKKSAMLLADEPTSNLDIEGIEIMEKMLEEYKGALIIISHDRNLLDKVCNKILEIEDGKIKIYSGNYSDYVVQKKQERDRAQVEYDKYVKEKKRLKEVVDNTTKKVRSIKKAPKRMGNSEARLHKMGGQKAKANLERAVKNIEKRIEHLDKKEKPKEPISIKLDLMETEKLHSKIIIEGTKLNKVFDEKIILKDAEFIIYNGSKVALIGPNGCGKSTLIKMIIERDVNIKIAKGVKIGYFSQDMNILKEDLSIIENVMESSIYPETFARNLLARLLFKREMVYKKVRVLSGGEKVKVSFAKILLQDFNLLILDEPTNYLDINSFEVIEEALREYDRTLLFISHDRSFIDAVADHIMTIEDHKTKMFLGNYKEYLNMLNKFLDNKNKEEIEKKIFILENRMSEIIGKLSMPSKNDDVELLDREYHEILQELKELKTKLNN